MISAFIDVVIVQIVLYLLVEFQYLTFFLCQSHFYDTVLIGHPHVSLCKTQVQMLQC
jgi:hypothetical protein